MVKIVKKRKYRSPPTMGRDIQYEDVLSSIFLTHRLIRQRSLGVTVRERQQQEPLRSASLRRVNTQNGTKVADGEDRQRVGYSLMTLLKALRLLPRS